MSSNELKMNHLTVTLGFWFAMVCVATFIIWMICFTAILIINPLFLWSNLGNFVTYTREHNQFFKHLAELAMVIFGAAFVGLLGCIGEYVTADKKILAKLSANFGIIFAVLSSMNYFLQFTAVRQGIITGEIAGLEQFITSNPYSAINAANMLGWTLFLGLASLFIAPVFQGGRLEKVIRYAFIINGAVCILGGVGYVFNIILLTGLCMNLGMGAALLAATIALSVLFGRKIKVKMER